ncbi:SPFH domain-containing protein [Candidatus Arthromitus sp. SFB-rat-Yit]|uniref:SPFH domain-containing protein n=1 Tax=Candidatus Arthromitus sp. SFB-rat-Yit TaxID=1041504 RepID=UPI0005C63AAA|nr:SPFH domain-containing protein [Candidatus Arthromitus sp. SFB-rat-Yit]
MVTILLFIVVVALIFGCAVVVPQAYIYVIERFGAYYKTFEVGIHFRIPFIDNIAKKISIKEQVIDFDPQPVITKDNVTMMIDTVVFYQVTDPKLYVYGVEHPILAIENLSVTTLRNIIGDLELDETLTSRDIVNGKMRSILDQATDSWGIKINRVELKNIIPPQEIQDSMEKQMKAERERRELILRAEGEKKSAILRAEGEKDADILRAEGKKQAAIKEAEGKAESILRIQKSLAESIKYMNEANPSDKVLSLKALESLEKVADGKATKIIIPSEIQNIASLTTSLAEIYNSTKE